MKKIIIFFFVLFFVIQISFALTLTETASDVNAGVFPEGSYYSSGIFYFGTETDPGLSSSTLPSLYVTNGDNYYGLYADSDSGPAVYAYSDGVGLYGYSIGAAGVYGSSTDGNPGVYGYDRSGDSTGIGVKSYSSDGYAFYSSSSPSYGLYIPYSEDYGVYASSDYIGGRFEGDNIGGYFEGSTYGGFFQGDYIGLSSLGEDIGVYAQGSSYTHKECAVHAYNTRSGETGYLGCYDYSIFTEYDARIEGDLRAGNAEVDGLLTAGTAEVDGLLTASSVYVDGLLTVAGSCSGCSDIAEGFAGNDLEPGDVVVLDPTTKSKVKKTNKAYDKLAAGIISTDPTIVMGAEEGVPVALSGVVPTKVIGTIHVGDLLTTSSTPGYAMACKDYSKCAGAIIGKAMEENKEGKGTITALVMLG